jgi:hypothetical protein
MAASFCMEFIPPHSFAASGSSDECNAFGFVNRTQFDADAQLDGRGA